MDTLLPQPDLDDLDNRFWSRYKVRYPAWVKPGDLLVSRLSREIGKRLLTVQDVWKTRTLLHQKRSKQKKTVVGEVTLMMGEAEEPDPVTHDLGTYLQLLFTLMLGYALAGDQPHPSPPTTPELRSSVSTTYVLVPLDVV